jgi:hypothetical protein
LAMTRLGALRRQLPSRRLAAAFLLLGYLPLVILAYSSLTVAQGAVAGEVNARVSSVAGVLL